MILTFDEYGSRLVVHMAGELDHHSAEEVRNKIDDKIDCNRYNVLIMDFNEVTFMDSSGIGVVIGRYKKLLLKGGKVCVINVKSSIKRVFELSGIFKIINSCDSLEQALDIL